MLEKQYNLTKIKARVLYAVYILIAEEYMSLLDLIFPKRCVGCKAFGSYIRHIERRMSLAMSQAGTATDNDYSMHFVGLLSPHFLLSSMPERVYQLSKKLTEILWSADGGRSYGVLANLAR